MRLWARIRAKVVLAVATTALRLMPFDWAMEKIKGGYRPRPFFLWAIRIKGLYGSR
jgi:hypothetical protein